MTRPEKMVRATLAGHKRYLEPLIDVLHELNIYHVEDYVEDEDSFFKIGKPIGYGEDVSRKLVKVRSISNYLDVNKSDAVINTDVLSSELNTRLEKLDKDISEKNSRKNALENRLKEIESESEELKPFLSSDLNMDYYSGYETLAAYTGTVSKPISEEHIREITNSSYLLYEGAGHTFSLFVPKEYERAVYSYIYDLGYRESRIPDRQGKPSDLLRALEAEKADVSTQLETLDADIAKLKEEYGDFIMASDEFLTILSEKAELPLRIATSENAFVIDGWVPENQFDLLAAAVNSKTDNRVYIQKQEVNLSDEEEVLKVPIKHNNKGFAKNFEWVVDLYSPPVYTEIDPSKILMMSFPLIYGLILGDMGYALVLLSLALLVKKFLKSEAINSMMNVLIACQISAFIFGFLYGEFMGMPLASYTGDGVTYPGIIPGFETIIFDVSIVPGEFFMFPIHRTHLMYTILLATVIFGLLHLNFGYLIGFFNLKNQHGLKEAVFAKGSWFVMQIGAIIAIAGYFIDNKILLVLGALIFIIGVIMLFLGEGIQGPIEIPGFFGNMLSYTRILAVGLSSIYIASTVNSIAFEMIWSPSSGFGLMTIVAIFVFVLGHTINSALSIIAPGLHALRLQYVEFFGKYYSGGGRMYNPFGYKRIYTEE
ncbi:MAG: V-type ATP synthase subunit I [Methanosarcinaceae archaeon]|nr:V-type ATP synthase subunit I [Methanosarcinaceae archaeon]